MPRLRKVRTKDYPYPVIFFKKGLEKIRNSSTSKQESKFLISMYFAFREVASDIEEGEIKESISKEKFIELLEEYSEEDIWDIDYLLARFTDLNIDTGIEIIGGSHVRNANI